MDNKKLEDYGYREGNIPTGIGYGKLDAFNGHTGIIYEDHKISIHPDIRKTNAGNEYALAIFDVDELQAIVDKARELWGK